MSKRLAILVEDGEVIFSGDPKDMPVRFIQQNGYLIESTTQNAALGGYPIDDETGEYLPVHSEA